MNNNKGRRLLRVLHELLQSLIDYFNVPVSLVAARKAIDNDKNIIAVFWDVDDIKFRAKEILGISLSEEVCQEILLNLRSNHDCNLGITWDSIDYYIDEHRDEPEILFL